MENVLRIPVTMVGLTTDQEDDNYFAARGKAAEIFALNRHLIVIYFMDGPERVFTIQRSSY